MEDADGLDEDGYVELIEREALLCSECCGREDDRDAWTAFNIRLLKGKLAQLIIETIFLEFDWLVFPFGYESYFTSVVKELSGKGGRPALKIRSMPDLVVVSSHDSRPHILEIKATTATGPYLLSETVATRYEENWPEAELVVYSTRNRAAYAANIGGLKIGDRPRTEFGDGTPAVSLEFDHDLIRLQEYFGFPSDDYDRILNKALYQFANWG